MTVANFSDKDRDVACIVHEADALYSRDEGTVALAAGVVKANTVMGKITASGKWVPYTPGAADGSQNAAGILLYAVDASAADAKGVLIARDAVINGNYLNWGPAVTTQNHKDTAFAALKALPGPLVVR